MYSEGYISVSLSIRFPIRVKFVEIELSIVNWKYVLEMIHVIYGKSRTIIDIVARQSVYDDTSDFVEFVACFICANT